MIILANAPACIAGRALRKLALVTALSGVFLSVTWSNIAAYANHIAIDIEARSIDNFRVDNNDQKQFGTLRYMGGIEYSSNNGALGGISGIRVLAGGNKFLAVSDKGKWFAGTIERDATGKITGISDARIAPLLDTKGEIITAKKMGDAEGIEIIGDRVLVSFERQSRIYDYQLDFEHLASIPKPFRPRIEKFKLPNNNGLEAITLLQPQKSHKLSIAKIVVFSEYALDDNGDIRGFFSKSKKWKQFSVKASDDFKITDATLLPVPVAGEEAGDILILERQFSIITGPIIRIRRMKAGDIKSGALIDGEIILVADSRFQIDNLEGISAWTNDKGQTVLTIISDNNFSFLQRNLLLEFVLLPGEN